MIETLDHLIIAVQDLDEAEENYKKIFGISPVWKGVHKELGTANVIFNFKNTYFELLSASGNGLGADLVNNQLKENGKIFFYHQNLPEEYFLSLFNILKAACLRLANMMKALSTN